MDKDFIVYMKETDEVKLKDCVQDKYYLHFYDGIFTILSICKVTAIRPRHIELQTTQVIASNIYIDNTETMTYRTDKEYPNHGFWELSMDYFPEYMI